jgi:UDP-N-acetylbacillosamine N-acetyltransferase
MNMRAGLVIWGASGHAMVVADIVRLAGMFELLGFLDDLRPDRWNTQFCGRSILGGREQLPLLDQMGANHLIMGFGDNQSRLALSELVRAEGLNLATAIHPGAILAGDVSVGSGTVVAAGAVVNPGSSLGENVIINTSASVDHECLICDGAHVSPGVRLAGQVTVGRAAWIGIGATVLPRVRIGERSVIGAGSVVLHDVPDGLNAYGVPAKLVKSRDANGG